MRQWPLFVDQIREPGGNSQKCISVPEAMMMHNGLNASGYNSELGYYHYL
jgi:hypothetical protein